MFVSASDAHFSWLRRALLVVCWLLWLALSASAQSGRRIQKPALPSTEAQAPDSLTINTTEVRLEISVRDSLGQAVPGLRAEDFLIYDNGRRYEALHCEPMRAPVKLLLLLEEGDGIFTDTEMINQTWLTWRKFLRARSPQDQLAVMRFSDEVWLTRDWHNDEAGLAQALKIGRGNSGQAALFDALAVAAAKLAREQGRTAIILLTSGLPSAGVLNLGDALAAVRGTGTPVYVLSQTEAIAAALPHTTTAGFLRATAIPAELARQKAQLALAEHELTQLAELSGGMIYFPLRESSLGWMLQQIAADLHTRYQVSYPLEDSHWTTTPHRIEVLVRGGHQAQAHSGAPISQPPISSRLPGASH